MSTWENIEEIEGRHICDGCVGEEFLGKKIRTSGEDGYCNYCDRETRIITIKELANEIETALEGHYSKTATEPEGFDYYLAKEGLWERAGETVAFVIAEAAAIDEAPAEDVRLILENRTYDFDMAQIGDEGPYDEDAHYEPTDPDDIEFRTEWQYFEQGIQEKSRFFSKSAMDVLNSVFGTIFSLKTQNDISIVVEAGPGLEIEKIFRARVFQSGEDLKKALSWPDQGLGPPPSRDARAGRMNPQGISVFYGAISEKTAIAEVRPPVGSRVAVGCFELLRPIKLLNVSALRDVLVLGSIFDPEYLKRLEHASFLERISHQFSQPVMSNDEPFDYLITQAIAEYLSEIIEPAVDGIIFSSAQTNDAGGNIVLFYPSSRVKKIEFPKGTEIESIQGHLTDEGFETNYLVWVKVPKTTPESDTGLLTGPLFSLLDIESQNDFSFYDDRPETLQLDVESVVVHHILSVTHNTSSHRVARHQTVIGDESF